MYELKRSPKIQESLKIGDEIITVDIDVESVAYDFNKQRNNVIFAEKNVAKAREALDNNELEAAMQNYGEAIIELFNLIFGTENTDVILKFYDNKYVEMCFEVFPFIVDVIMPQMKAGADELREKAASRYKQSKGSPIIKRIKGKR